MTPEEFERYKDAETEHLKKLKELKQAVRVLERRRKLRSALEKVSRSSEKALAAQKDAVDRLALETATQEARLEIALDSASQPTRESVREELDEEMRRARARALVDELKTSIETDKPENQGPDRARSPAPEGGGIDEASAHPTEDRENRPDKTIGRM